LLLQFSLSVPGNWVGWVPPVQPGCLALFFAPLTVPLSPDISPQSPSPRLWRTKENAENAELVYIKEVMTSRGETASRSRTGATAKPWPERSRMACLAVRGISKGNQLALPSPDEIGMAPEGLLKWRLCNC